jgi:hypothetical protein
LAHLHFHAQGQGARAGHALLQGLVGKALAYLAELGRAVGCVLGHGRQCQPCTSSERNACSGA